MDAELLPSLPFVLFQSVLENHPPNTREGADLRQQAVDKGALQFLLALLAVFTQQVNSVTINIKRKFYTIINILKLSMNLDYSYLFYSI